MNIKLEDPNFTFSKVNDKCKICRKLFKYNEKILYIQESKAVTAKSPRNKKENLMYREDKIISDPPDGTTSKVMIRNDKFSKFYTVHADCFKENKVH